MLVSIGYQGGDKPTLLRNTGGKPILRFGWFWPGPGKCVKGDGVVVVVVLDPDAYVVVDVKEGGVGGDGSGADVHGTFLDYIVHLESIAAVLPDEVTTSSLKGGDDTVAVKLE